MEKVVAILKHLCLALGYGIGAILAGIMIVALWIMFHTTIDSTRCISQGDKTECVLEFKK